MAYLVAEDEATAAAVLAVSKLPAGQRAALAEDRPGAIARKGFNLSIPSAAGLPLRVYATILI